MEGGQEARGRRGRPVIGDLNEKHLVKIIGLLRESKTAADSNCNALLLVETLERFILEYRKGLETAIINNQIDNEIKMISRWVDCRADYHQQAVQTLTGKVIHLKLGSGDIIGNVKALLSFENQNWLAVSYFEDAYQIFINSQD